MKHSFVKRYCVRLRLRYQQFLFLLLFVASLNWQFSNAHERNEAAKTPATTKTETQKKEINKPKPNILIILIDDMGFNDVSFTGSNQILTPNIDALAYNGIILNQNYVPNLCTPSRATLLTGKYPIHTGTQHFVIINDEPWGLPLSEHLMSEIFRDAGYSTNLIGKWHLGFWKKEMTPTMRGFDYHYGYYSGYIDYYDYTLRMLDRNYSIGLDLRRNLEPSREANGTYATDEFTREAVRLIRDHDEQKPLFLILSHLAVHTGNEDNPMQSPPPSEEEVEKFAHISDEKRRKYAGMISRLDWSVGKTIRALSDKGILNNTIVLLYSDNGAPTVGMHSNAGSNYPFRGQKQSPWEGAIRSAGLIWSPLLQQKGYVSNQTIYAADWLPTLATAADIQIPSHLKLDGMDQWSTLSENLPVTSRTLPHVLDDEDGYAAYMRGNFKYINGTSFDGQYDGWLGEAARSLQENDPLTAYYAELVLSSEVNEIVGRIENGLGTRSGSPELNTKKIEKMRNEATHRCPPTATSGKSYAPCAPLKAPCLFNIEEDPCERNNLASTHSSILADMERQIEALRATAVKPARIALSDPLSDPRLHNGTWEWWSQLTEQNSSSAASLTNKIGCTTGAICGIWRSLYNYLFA